MLGRFENCSGQGCRKSNGLSRPHWGRARTFNGTIGSPRCWRVDATMRRAITPEPDERPVPVATWRKANPSLAWMPALRYRIEKEANEAREDLSKLASFKALRLNLGVSDVMKSYLIEAQDWIRIEAVMIGKAPMFSGLISEQTAAMSAAAAYWPETGELEAVACFPRYAGPQGEGPCGRRGRLVSGYGRTGRTHHPRKKSLRRAGLLSEVRR